MSIYVGNWHHNRLNHTELISNDFPRVIIAMFHFIFQCRFNFAFCKHFSISFFLHDSVFADFEKHLRRINCTIKLKWVSGASLHFFKIKSVKLPKNLNHITLRIKQFTVSFVVIKIFASFSSILAS